jgi:hypothetical protein
LDWVGFQVGLKKHDFKNASPSLVPDQLSSGRFFLDQLFLGACPMHRSGWVCARYSTSFLTETSTANTDTSDIFARQTYEQHWTRWMLFTTSSTRFEDHMKEKEQMQHQSSNHSLITTFKGF